MAAATPTWKRKRDGIYSRADSQGRTRYRAVVWVRDPGWAPDPSKPRNTPARKQVAKTFDRLEDAKDWREDFGGTKPKKAPRQSRVTLRELRDELESSEEYASATLARDRSVWVHVEAGNLADRPIAQVTREDVERALSGLADRPEMQAKTRSMLSKLFTHAIDTGRADSNLATKTRKPKTRAARIQAGKRTGHRVRVMTDDELARLVSELPERWRAMVELMAYSGLRPGEAVVLSVGKFEPLKRTLRIDTSLSGFTKTGEERELVLPAVVAEILAEHLARFSDPKNPEAPMFPREDGTAIDSKNAYSAWSRRHFAPAAWRAGVNGGLSPNDLRHHAVAFAIGHGADVYCVQRMVGHARPSITLDVYGFLWDSSGEKLAEHLDAAIRASRVQVRDADVVGIG
jgi:integrase